MEQGIGVEFTKIRGKYYATSEVDAYILILQSHYKEIEGEMEELQEKISWLELTRTQEHKKAQEVLSDRETELEDAKKELDDSTKKLNDIRKELDNERKELEALRDALNQIKNRDENAAEQSLKEGEKEETQHSKEKELEKSLLALEKELKNVEMKNEHAAAVHAEQIKQLEAQNTALQDEKQQLEENLDTLDLSQYRSEKYVSIIDSAVQMADTYVYTVGKKMDELLKETEERTDSQLDEARQQSFDIIREAKQKADILESETQENVRKVLDSARAEYADIRALIEKSSQEYAHLTSREDFTL